MLTLLHFVLLSYFVNDEDEIRCIESPDHYFKFFIDRNDRINQRQRFVFDREKCLFAL